MVEVSAGGFALAGYTNSFGAGSTDFWLVKTDEFGIPEFPSWIILPLFITTTLLILICKQRLTKTSSNGLDGCNPRMTVSGAFYRLALSEGQKEIAWRLKAVQETQKMEEKTK